MKRQKEREREREREKESKRERAWRGTWRISYTKRNIGGHGIWVRITYGMSKVCLCSNVPFFKICLFICKCFMTLWLKEVRMPVWRWGGGAVGGRGAIWIYIYTYVCLCVKLGIYHSKSRRILWRIFPLLKYEVVLRRSRRSSMDRPVLCIWEWKAPQPSFDRWLSNPCS